MPREATRVLVVDDEPDIRMILERGLQHRGFDVTCASDGQEALERLELDRPDVILLDVMMPTCDGFAFCKQLQERKATRDIPVIFLTSRNDVPNRVAGLN